MSHLLAGLFAAHDLRRYTSSQRRDPQPAMRRVDRRGGSFHCWVFEDRAWVLTDVVSSETDATTFWLGDPWLPPNDPGRAGRTTRAAQAAGAEWPEHRWAEVVEGLAFHVVTETGARPHELGPESQWTSARVYERLRDQGAAAQVYWSEGRTRMDDLRASCPIRTDLPYPLRCVALAEATVLLLRRPHAGAYVHVDSAPAGVAAEAAAVLRGFEVPQSTLDLLLR